MDSQETTTQQVVHKNKLNPPNKEGRGGFGEHPEHQSPGGWKKENTISYQYRRFMNMSADELKDFAKSPDSEKTMAMVIAFKRVLAAAGSKGLMDAKEITDRLEGKAPQNIDVTSGGDPITFSVVNFLDADNPDTL